MLQCSHKVKARYSKGYLGRQASKAVSHYRGKELRLKSTIPSSPDWCSNMYMWMQVLGRRVTGLSEGLENAAVQWSRQREMVQRMKKELKETQEFVEVNTNMHVCMYVNDHSNLCNGA